MPKGKGYKGNSSGNSQGDTPFSELPHHEQLRRAKSAKSSANDDMKAARNAGDKGKEASATKAWSAANRVINRLGESAPPPAKGNGKEGKESAKGKDKKDKPKGSLSQVAEAARRAREAKERR